MTRIPLLIVSTVLLVPAISRAGDKEVYRIGIPKSAFRDVPPSLLSFAGMPFKDLMKSQTGLDGDVVLEPEALEIAEMLESGKLQLGVFLGHEFAWARDKHPTLEPIVCTVPRPKEIQAFLLVRYDNKAQNLGDLKGCKLALATTTRDHARMFLEKKRSVEMTEGAFCSTEKAPTVHDAINKVIEGDADVTVADQAAWNYFQKLYPGASGNLRVLAKSEVFPPTVIAFKKGSLDDAVIKKVREGLLTAHETSKVAKLLNLIKVEKFDQVPGGYDETLKECLKAYPAPPGVK
ncbi:MAG TPA: PhnD/SsuA/transferrin family substrate-binding protein [Gemmataceae bacterium]|nr:PhnD/SsuA/transferrin family substrate-binding protein [Gemmataceae bacterium]